MERARLAALSRAENRAAWVLAWVFSGTLTALFLPSWILESDQEWSALALSSLADLIVVFVAALCLGQAASNAIWGRGFGGIRDHALGVVVGSLGWTLSLVYVYFLFQLIGGGDASEEEWMPLTVPILLGAIVAAPILEELLCRGVAWQAAREFANERTAIVITATLFAVLHGLNGAWFFEFPHRFAGGLALGWLRARTGSLAPCITAHFVWNVLATFLSN